MVDRLYNVHWGLWWWKGETLTSIMYKGMEHYLGDICGGYIQGKLSMFRVYSISVLSASLYVSKRGAY